MQPACERDLWDHLKETDKKIVLYGMGNGADKILSVCKARGIPVCGIFASDGFARGNLFHGMPVETWSRIRTLYGAENVIVLLSFGTSRPEVLENIRRIEAESELYAPDVPVFGEGLFDRAYCLAHEAELQQAEQLLSDEESRGVLRNVIRYRLTGCPSFLYAAESDPERNLREIVCADRLRVAVDLGAYHGETVRELIDAGAGHLQTVYAWEPDSRNFRRLEMYAAEETRATVKPICGAAWSEEGVLTFDGSGNRNASAQVNRSSVLREAATLRQVTAMTVDRVLSDEQVDYIKYDVEGSEREALLGSAAVIRRNLPVLAVSLYHRVEDLFILPLTVHRLFPAYRFFYLRRPRGIPAWDLMLYCKP